MASSIDVSPALGHALLATQLGVGSSPGYDAIDLRRMAAVGMQEGAHDSGGWKVTEHSPNGMSVDVASNVGIATITGDTVTAQGQYVVSPHSSVGNLTIATADATNPRIDTIILHAYDTTHDGLGANKASMEVLTGTPTSGATLSNRTGAQSLPNSALLLADVLVAAGTGTITNSNIRDRRKWANGFMWRGVSTAGNVALTTAGAELLTGQLKARLECAGGLVLVVFSGWITSSSADPQVQIIPLVDGLPQDTTSSLSVGNAADWPHTNFVRQVPSAEDGTVGWATMLSVSAGSHLFSIWGTRFNGASLIASGATPAIFSAREIVGAGSANNGIS